MELGSPNGEVRFCQGFPQTMSASAWIQTAEDRRATGPTLRNAAPVRHSGTGHVQVPLSNGRHDGPPTKRIPEGLPRRGNLQRAAHGHGRRLSESFPAIIRASGGGSAPARPNPAKDGRRPDAARLKETQRFRCLMERPVSLATASRNIVMARLGPSPPALPCPWSVFREMAHRRAYRNFMGHRVIRWPDMSDLIPAGRRAGSPRTTNRRLPESGVPRPA